MIATKQVGRHFLSCSERCPRGLLVQSTNCSLASLWTHERPRQTAGTADLMSPARTCALTRTHGAEVVVASRGVFAN